MSKIIELKAENVKRLRAVQIKPDGNIVSIGGKNGAGKTSVLDSIMYALAGKESLPKVPVRRGEEKAVVVLELDDMIIKRTFTAEGGTSLVVTNKEGLKFPSPQGLLDALVGRLSFDPLEFSRIKPEAQASTLRQLVGLDLSAINTERQGYYDSRTIVGREVKSLESRVGALPMVKAGLPDEEVSAADILKEQQEAMAFNAENQKKREIVSALGRSVEEIEDESDRFKQEHEEITAEINQLTEKLKAKEQAMKENRARFDVTSGAKAAQVAAAEALVDKDMTSFSERVNKVDATNRDIRNNSQRKKLEAELKEKHKEQDALTAKLEAVDAKKVKLLEETKFPIDGLTVGDDGGVLFNGLPLEQAASAEQLRVSVAIGLALNPKLRVLLIRDGSLLDEDSLALLLEMAEKQDAQVWIERVGTTGEVSVIIEDGMVRAQTPAESAPVEPKKEGQLL